jgi:hypothetical protein
MVASGIRFNDYLFTEPARLVDWQAPKYAGLFVILAQDANWAPKPYQPLYFGEFGNNTPETLLPGNHAIAPAAEGSTMLFISVLPMPFSTTAQRWALRNELLWAYNATWQATEVRAAVSGLANQLGEVDKTPHQQQAAQLLHLLTGANKSLETQQPEREPRRRIGFV